MVMMVVLVLPSWVRKLVLILLLLLVLLLSAFLVTEFGGFSPVFAGLWLCCAKGRFCASAPGWPSGSRHSWMSRLGVLAHLVVEPPAQSHAGSPGDGRRRVERPVRKRPAKSRLKCVWVQIRIISTRNQTMERRYEDRLQTRATRITDRSTTAFWRLVALAFPSLTDVSVSQKTSFFRPERDETKTVGSRRR